MFIIPRKSNSNAFSSKRYERGTVVYDNTSNTSEIERKYAPYIKELKDLVKEINTEIYTSKRKAKELSDMNAKKAVDIEIESAKNRASLYTTKMNAIKSMSSLVKEIKELELKEQKLMFDMTGKNVDTKGSGNLSQKAFMATAMGLSPSDIPRSIHALPSYDNSAEQSDLPSNVNGNKKQLEVKPMNDIVQSNTPISPAEVVEQVEETKEKDSRFTGIFEVPEKPDVATGISGNDHVQDYDKMNNRFSYGVAETGLVNKYKMTTKKKCHYDEERGLGWIRTYDVATGKIATPETFVSPEYHGVFHVTQSGGMRYAIDEVDNNYDIVPDKFENAPDEIKEELLRVNKRAEKQEDMG